MSSRLALTSPQVIAPSPSASSPMSKSRSRSAMSHCPGTLAPSGDSARYASLGLWASAAPIHAASNKTTRAMSITLLPKRRTERANLEAAAPTLGRLTSRARPIPPRRAPGAMKSRRPRRRAFSSRHGRSADIAAGFIAIDMPAVLAVVGRRQEREVSRDAVRGDVDADHPRGPLEEVDAVADVSGDIIGSTHHADDDVGHVVIGTPPVGPARRVAAQRRAEAALGLRRGRRHAQIEPQQFGARRAA